MTLGSSSYVRRNRAVRTGQQRAAAARTSAHGTVQFAEETVTNRPNSNKEG